MWVEESVHRHDVEGGVFWRETVRLRRFVRSGERDRQGMRMYWEASKTCLRKARSGCQCNYVAAMFWKG